MNDRSYAEVDQIRSIVSLGYVYKKIQEFVSKFELKWNKSNVVVDTYQIALTNGISDVLADYVDDVAFLETICKLVAF